MDVIITYLYNEHSPSFNVAKGEGSIEDAEQCDPAAGCLVDFTTELRATDADGDGVVYSILPMQAFASSFSIVDDRDLSSLIYTSGIIDSITVQLIIQVLKNIDFGLTLHTDLNNIPLFQAKDVRQDIDQKVATSIIDIAVSTTATTPTQAPSTSTAPGPGQECDDSNKQLYFILMLVFASLLGLALLAALCTPIILKLCR